MFSLFSVYWFTALNNAFRTIFLATWATLGMSLSPFILLTSWAVSHASCMSWLWDCQQAKIFWFFVCLFCFVFCLRFYLFVRERASTSRGSAGQREKQASWAYELSWRQMLNLLSHPGVSIFLWGGIFLFFVFCLYFAYLFFMKIITSLLFG